MPLGPKQKSELELHWQHQLDHVRADLRNIYRRLQNETEVAAFDAVKDAFEADGSLIELRTQPGALEDLVRKTVKQLPRGDA